MSKLSRSKTIIIYLVLFLLSVVPLCIKSNYDKTVPQQIKEKFNPSYASVNSMDRALEFVDSLYQIEYGVGTLDTLGYVKTLSKFTKNRFYHGLSHYSLADNWLIYLSGKLVWSHFSAIVRSDDILKHSEGLCSQQTLFFLDVLKRKKIHFRSVGLGYTAGPGHFLCEVKYKGDWHLYDVTLEPDWGKITNGHMSMSYYKLNSDSLYKAYSEKLPRPVFNKILERVEYGKDNVLPAGNMRLFHNFMFFVIYFLPVLFLGLAIRAYTKKVSQKQPKAGSFDAKITESELIEISETINV